MRVREYTGADLAALQQMHAAQGFDYPFPDLSDPIFVCKFVVEDKAGRPAMASLVRLTSEVYLLGDPSAGTPLERLKRVLILHRTTEMDALRRGLQDAHAFLPPPVEKSFGRRLRRLGWVRDPWACYCKRLEAY